MSHAESFAPIADRHARVLILGSMPGQASLREQQYYAHPRNAFWPIMGRLFGAGPDLPYAVRQRRLTQHGVAVWDVLKSCWRPGSLDAAIEASSVEINDFDTFLARHPQVTHLFFNGGKAEETFRRHVTPSLPLHGLQTLRLPSTSPAHAARSLEDKYQAWCIVADVLGITVPGHFRNPQ